MLDPDVIRETLLSVLSIFARVEQQLSYNYSPGELYCQWFDDVYHPNVAAWQKAFSESEICALATFTATLHCHSVYIDRRDLSYLLGTQEWNDICASAMKALAVMMHSP